MTSTDTTTRQTRPMAARHFGEGMTIDHVIGGRPVQSFLTVVRESDWRPRHIYLETSIGAQMTVSANLMLPVRVDTGIRTDELADGDAVRDSRGVWVLVLAVIDRGADSPSRSVRAVVDGRHVTETWSASSVWERAHLAD